MEEANLRKEQDQEEEKAFREEQSKRREQQQKERQMEDEESDELDPEDDEMKEGLENAPKYYQPGIIPQAPLKIS